MFCHNCGTKIESIGRYCPNCGVVLNSLPPVKEMSTKVDYDYNLPTNNNFMYVAMFVVSLIIAGCVFLSSYHKKYDYNVSVNYHDYKVFLPIGFKTTLGDGDETDDNSKELYVYNDDVKYSIQDFNDNYKFYTMNDFDNTKALLKLRGYEVLNTKEVKYGDKGMIVSKFTMGEDTIYFYIYDYSNDDIVFSGFIYPNDDEEVTIETSVERLYKILSKIKE